MAELTSLITLLPKPTALAFNYPKSWDTQEASVWGALTQKNWVGAGYTGAIDFASDATGGQATAAALRANNVGINKRNAAIFQDLPFREVSFSWVLRPRNAAKASTYMTVIEILKYYSAPSLALHGALFDVSGCIWSLEIKTNIVGIGSVLFRANELVIKDISVNYTPNNFWSQHVDGFPTEINLTLSMMELELAVRSRLSIGGTGPGIV